MVQEDLFPGTKPKVAKGVIKSAIQKAYRRNHQQLFEWAFENMWDIDPKWLIWRSTIITAEEAWPLTLRTGEMVRRIKTLTTSKNPMAWKKAKDMLKTELSWQARFTKNKDADGLRWLAEKLAAWRQDSSMQAEVDKILGAIHDKVPLPEYETLMQLIELEVFAAQRRFVPRETWGPIWAKVEELQEKLDEDTYQGLRDQVGACYFRSKEGGMLGDRTLLVSAALFSLDALEHGLHGWDSGDGLERTDEVRMQDSFGELQEVKDGVPPWYCADMHTGPGKRALAYCAKRFPYQKRIVSDMWFLEESAQVNETHAHSKWWEIARKTYYLANGFTMESAGYVWQEVGPVIKEKVSIWMLEG